MPTRTTIAFASFLGSALLLGAGCPTDPSGPDPIFPEEYEATYREVRDCRRSIEHDNMFIRVLADPAAYEPYMTRAQPFPAGATVLKLEYADDDCTDLDGFAVMRKEEAGYAPDLGDWHWQGVTLDRTVDEEQSMRCSGCHTDCGEPPDGYDFTCTVP